MTVQLFEGCWGVTKGREIQGPVRAGTATCYEFAAPKGCYRADGRFGWGHEEGKSWSSSFDIIAVFATEAEAKAYLAVEKPCPRRSVGPMPANSPESDALARMGVNGAAWAAEFHEVAVRLGYSAMDEGWLIGWFANAIEAGRGHSAPTAAPKPVTWPDGAWEVCMDSGAKVSANKGFVDTTGVDLVSFPPEQARQLAALILAAADYVEGRG